MRAELAQREASANLELANAGRAAHDLAHDLGNLVAILHLNLHDFEWNERENARAAVRDVQAAALAMYGMFAAWRGESARSAAGSSAFLLTTLCSLVSRTGVTVEPRIEAPLAFEGADDDVVRVLENLLITACRQAIRAGDPRVHVEMSAGELRISTRLPERPEEQPSAEARAGRAARGVTIARQAAARVGWRIVQTVDDERTTFVVRPA